VKRTVCGQIASFVALALVALFLLAACEADEPRIIPVATYNPGPQFSTNFNYGEDLRRQVKCTIIFEVVDEAAALELEAFNFAIRNSVLNTLGELTIDEITVERDLVEIGKRIVDRVNADLEATEDLILRAYFTDFSIA